MSLELLNALTDMYIAALLTVWIYRDQFAKRSEATKPVLRFSAAKRTRNA